MSSNDCIEEDESKDARNKHKRIRKDLTQSKFKGQVNRNGSDSALNYGVEEFSMSNTEVFKKAAQSKTLKNKFKEHV